MPFIQRYSDVKKGGILFCGNTLGLSKTPNQNAPGTEGQIGAFTSLDNTLQVGTFPQGTTLDYTRNGSRAILDLPVGSTILYAELIWGGLFRSSENNISALLNNSVTFTTPQGTLSVAPDPATAQTFDIPACDYTIVSPKDEKTSLILDGNGYTTYYLPQGKQELVVQLAKEMPISGFRYTPNQGRDASGHISNYQLYINGKKVAEGEFSNIKANPIEQVVHFPITKGNQIRLVATRIVDNKKQAGIGEFSVITEK